MVKGVPRGRLGAGSGVGSGVGAGVGAGAGAAVGALAAAAASTEQRSDMVMPCSTPKRPAAPRRTFTLHLKRFAGFDHR